MLLSKFWPSSEGRSTIPRDIQLKAKPSASAAEVVDLALDTRNADRFVPRKTATTLTTEEGRTLKARIVNVSAVAVAVEADLASVDPESVSHVGAYPVTFGRKIRLGAVFVFVKPISVHRANENIVL